MFKERLEPKTDIKFMKRTAPCVLILSTALNKMQAMVEGCSNEIGWYCTTSEQISGETHIIFVEDAYMPTQQVHSTTTESDAENYQKFAEEILAMDNGMDIWNKMRVWGHSHVNMSITPSGQDDKQMDKFAQTGYDWFMRIIANKKGDLKVDVYDYKTGTIFNNCPWRMWEDPDVQDIDDKIYELEKQKKSIKENRFNSIKEKVTQEIKDKVSEIKYAQVTNFQGNYEYDEHGVWVNGVFYPYNYDSTNETKDEKKKDNKKEKMKNKENKQKQFNNDVQHIITCNADIVALFTKENLEKIKAEKNYFEKSKIIMELIGDKEPSIRDKSMIIAYTNNKKLWV